MASSKQLFIRRGRAGGDFCRRAEARQGRRGHAWPHGRNVILQKSFGSPKVTKDGVTVSKEIELPNPFENMGAKMANQVASKTADVAGDGTTTAVVLAEAIMKEGLKNVTAGPTRWPSSAESTSPSRRPSSPSPAGQEGQRNDDLRKVATVSDQLEHRHRRVDRAGLREGRQGRRHHRRGRQEHTNELKGRRGHAVRQGLHQRYS